MYLIIYIFIVIKINKLILIIDIILRLCEIYFKGNYKNLLVFN